MPKRVFSLLIFIINFSIFGSIDKSLLLQVKLEQLNVPITKTFSIRANSINTVLLNTSKSVLIKEIYLELSDGTFVVLDMNRLVGKATATWKMKGKNIKTITFTARTSSLINNQIELALRK